VERQTVNKVAAVVLVLDKIRDGFWVTILNQTIEQDKKTVHDLGDIVLSAFSVDHYSLEDHQFLQVRVTVKNKKMLFWIPRELVKAIVEGGPEVHDAFSFASGKKSKQVS